MSGIKRNIIATVYSLFTSIGGQLLVVPVFIHQWGTELYGCWLVLYTIPAYVALSDIGVTSSLGNELTISVKNGNTAHGAEMLNSVWKCQFLLWAALFVLFFLCILCLPFQQWIGVTRISRLDFIVCSLVLCLFSLTSLQAGVFCAIFRAASRFDRYVLWSSHGRMGETMVTIAILMAGGGPISLAFGLLSIKSLLFCYFWITHVSLLPNIKLSWRGSSWHAFGRLLPSGVAFMALPVGAALVNQGVLVIVNRQFGPAVVVVLNISRQVSRLYYNLMNALFVAIHPELTNAYAERDSKRMADLYALGMGAVCLSALPAVVVMALIGPKLVLLWTGGKIVIGMSIVFWCTIEAASAALGQNAALPAYAINQPILVCAVFAISNAIAFVSLFPLVHIYSVSIVPIVFAISNMLFASYAYRNGISIVGGNILSITRAACDPHRLLRYLRMQK